MRLVVPLLLSCVASVLLFARFGEAIAAYLPLFLLTLVGLGMFGWFKPRPEGGVNPLGAYLLMVGIGLVMYLCVWALSFLGPGGVIVLIVALAGFTTVFTLYRGEHQRRQWALAGRCDGCGYDLRASEAVCPECGSRIPEELARRRRIQEQLSARREAEQQRSGAMLLRE